MISKEEIFSIRTKDDFHKVALKIFRFQSETNPVYANFIKFLNLKPNEIDSLEKIPFLPIRFFKSHEVVSDLNIPQKIFTSSGTTGSITSKHFVTDLSFYRESLEHSFRNFYGEFSDYNIF